MFIGALEKLSETLMIVSEPDIHNTSCISIPNIKIAPVQNESIVRNPVILMMRQIANKSPIIQC